MSDCLQLDNLDKTAGGDWSDLHSSPDADSHNISHSAELQDVTLSAASIGATGMQKAAAAAPPPPRSGPVPEPRVTVRLSGTARLTSPRFHLIGGDVEDVRQQRKEALEQQQQMKILEWENRMKVLAWEQDLVKEKRRATRQKEKAFRMKKAYYKAKLRRMGESVPQSSSSSSDEEEKTTGPIE